MTPRLSSVALVFGLVACASPVGPPGNVEDACAIKQERSDWYQAARSASEKWDVPTPLMLAIIWRESRFQPEAKPPRTYALGFIPTGRQSSAYGFPQAIDGTWDWYQESADAGDADRDNFADSADFVGWYMAQTRRSTGLPMHDAMGHYLAYHEGHSGFKSGRWKQNPSLKKAARQVAHMTSVYDRQLRQCDAEYTRAMALKPSPIPMERPFALARVTGTLPLAKPKNLTPASYRSTDNRSDSDFQGSKSDER